MAPCEVVAEPGTKDLLKEAGVHHLLLGALLDPQALGIPYLEDQSCRSIALLAKVPLLLSPTIPCVSQITHLLDNAGNIAGAPQHQAIWCDVSVCP